MTAASNEAKTVFNYNGDVPVIFSFAKKATSDWTIFGDYPGVINCRGTLNTGADEASLTYGTAAAAANSSTGTAVGSTSGTLLNITSGKITRVPPYYLLEQATGEIMLVLSETAANNATSTLTVKRGVLGTTAASITASDTLSIMNCIIWGASTTGLITGTFLPLTSTDSQGIFGTTGN